MNLYVVLFVDKGEKMIETNIIRVLFFFYTHELGKIACYNDRDGQ